MAAVASLRSVATELLDLAAEHGAEHVALVGDDDTGLRAIVAIDSTVLGPALGGTRFYPFASEHDALLDVLRLARGMTYKHAACGNDLGGGKAVIVGDPRTIRTDDLMRAYGRFIDRLGGRYLTAEDVGTTQADMDLLHTVTPYVTGVSEELGGSGDPSNATAWGVLHAMHAVAERLWGSPELAGRHVAIAGVGKVGSALARHLHEAGARLTVADVRPDPVGVAVSELGAASAPVEQIHAVECDIFSPCALGAGLNERTIPELRCEAVCGSANNQLEEEADGERIAARGVLYAPDYVANAGGVINIAVEAAGESYDRDAAFAARQHHPRHASPGVHAGRRAPGDDSGGGRPAGRTASGGGRSAFVGKAEVGRRHQRPEGDAVGRGQGCARAAAVDHGQQQDRLGPSGTHHGRRLEHRHAPGDGVLGDHDPVARLEGARDAPARAVVLVLLAHAEAAQGPAAGRGDGGDAERDGVGPHREAADRGGVVRDDGEGGLRHQQHPVGPARRLLGVDEPVAALARLEHELAPPHRVRHQVLHQFLPPPHPRMLEALLR